jgi:selenocysteine lyase/cysteine desulfurase
LYSKKSTSPFSDSLLKEIRERFYYVDYCPFQGKRIFFENAGGSLTLKSVVQRSSEIACIPDNEHRDNPAAIGLSKIVDSGKSDLADFYGASSGIIFGGETGTECLFRLIRAAAMAAPAGGSIVASSVEHPSSYDATFIWAERTCKQWLEVAFEHQTAIVTAQDYLRVITPDTRVATIIHTSPVTGMVMDVAVISKAIRSVAPDCFIIVDGIQHAPHGCLEVEQYDIDAYVISLYKAYSKFNNGYAWVSDRLSVVPHDRLLGKPDNAWELGSRDPSALAAATEVVNYLDWLGSHFTGELGRRARLKAAGSAISEHEQCLMQCLLFGTDKVKGLLDYQSLQVIGDPTSSQHESVASFSVKGWEPKDIVAQLSERNIRIHARSNDAYSGNILRPLKLESVSRVSLAHYNSLEEVIYFLEKLREIIGD